eukprot:TRINITY_DN5027_c0_g1_i8.p1 TRINITY_DN5027_c0_g1~~TRINITY_DN5027_c0_g1_i8.p1  ORF type:complete len:274 (+),score=48.30 TRINITY_DN5027_c0_g1_i8:1646-2467(+)
MVWEDSNTPSLRVNNHFIDTCVLSPKVSNPTNTPKNVESLSSRRRNSEGYFVKPFSSLQLVPPEISQSSPVLPGNQFSECDVPVDRMRMAICGSLKEATLDELLLCYIYCTPSKSVLQNLIIAHGNFFPSTTLIDAIANVYMAIDQRESNKTKNLHLKMRAINIVKLWAETFNQTRVSEDLELVSKFKDLIALLARSNSTIADHISLVLDRGGPTQVPILFSVLPHPHPLSLCSFSPMDIAKQLCLINCRLNSTVKLKEFYDSGWTKGISRVT